LLAGSLTGEPFNEDDIFDDEEHRYDHTIVLATPSVFDCEPKRYCIKHPRRTTLYEWTINKENLRLIQGIERSFTGNYKIIIDSHGDGAVISDLNNDSVTELPLGGQYVADKLHKLIIEKEGCTPSKIALQHCNIGNNPPYLNFRTRFTGRLAYLGYHTKVSVPRIGCPVLSATTGRKIYHREGLLGLTILLPSIKKTLPFWNEIQTKDKALHDRYIAQGCRRVNNMKATYRIENGTAMELADPDFPELI